MADSEGITVVDIPESSSVASMQKKLEEKRKEFKTTTRSSKWMYKFPASLTGISPKAIEPEIVSIGPYHRGQAELSKFESYKWLFLDGLLDVTFLCSDAIINTGFLQNGQNVGELFKKLGQKVSFKIRDCYLSQQFRDVEAYYSSHRATFIRNYFSKPWSFISVSYALILLVLTGGQIVMSIASYINDRRKN